MYIVGVRNEAKKYYVHVNTGTDIEKNRHHNCIKHTFYVCMN